jgi:hypothetical protein
MALSIVDLLGLFSDQSKQADLFDPAIVVPLRRE